MKLTKWKRTLIAGISIAAISIGMLGYSTTAGAAPTKKVAALLDQMKGLKNLEALKFFNSLENKGLTNSQIMEFFINLPLSKANKSVYDLYESLGFANGAAAYPAAKMVDGFQWKSGMGKKIVGPYTKAELMLPFSDDYVPLPAGPIGDPSKTYTIGVVSGGLVDKWIASYQDSMGYVAARHSNVKLDIRDYAFDMAKYATEVDSLIAKKVDAIVTWPMVESSSAAPLKRATEAGIPVITADRITGFKGIAARITGNFPANGAQNGMYLVWKLAQESKGTKVAGNVVVLGKPAGSTADLIRGGYFLKVVSYFPGIKILKYQNVDDSRQKGLEAAQNMFAAYDKIDAVYAEDGDKAVVTAQAAEQAGRTKRSNGQKLIILSTDDSKELFALIKAGKVSVNAPYTPLIGDIQMRVTLKIITGQKVPQDVATPDIPMVTRKGDKIFGLQTQKPSDWMQYTYG